MEGWTSVKQDFVGKITRVLHVQVVPLKRRSSDV